MIRTFGTLIFFFFIQLQWADAQYSQKKTRLDPDDDFRNFIGAKLTGNAESYLYQKTADGRDSVLLSYVMFSYPYKTEYSNDAIFTGTMYNGEMRTGTLKYQNIVYTGDFRNNKANGIGTLYVDNLSVPNRDIEFKGLFVDGIPLNGNIKTDFDSAHIPHLYYSGTVLFHIETQFSLLMHGHGALLRTSPVPAATFFYNHSIGTNNSYYEGQFYYGACTGFGIYNFYFPSILKNSSLYCGLVMGDLSLWMLHALPFNLDDNVINKQVFADSNNLGVRHLLPELCNTQHSFYLFNGRRYAGLSYNDKPYGNGFMEDAEGFRDVGFWNNGEKIPTMQLLAAVLPDSTVLKPYVVKNKTLFNFWEYSKKNKKYEQESVTMAAKVYHFGKMENGKMQGWGWRLTELANGGLCTNASAGLFTSSVVIPDNSKDLLPDAENIFDIAYTQVFGTGELNQTYVGIMDAAKYRYYSGATHNQVAKLIKPPFTDISLAVRDVNMLAVSEYRSRRDIDIMGAERYITERRNERQLAEAKKKADYDALFLAIKNPDRDDILQCVNTFYMDRSGNYLYKINSVDEYKGSFAATMYYVRAFANVQTITLTISQLLSSGNYRKVQNYVTCRSCQGTGIYTTTYKYTADYEYTYGAKVTTTTTKTGSCACGCGFEPEIRGAKIDW